MSWNFIKVGRLTKPEPLKRAIGEEHCPASVKAALVRGVNDVARMHANNPAAEKLAIVVRTHGHLDDAEKIDSYNGDIVLRVDVAPLIDTE